MSEGLPAVNSGWDFQDPSASEVNFRDLVHQGQEAGDPAYVVIAMTQLARSMGMQRRFHDATDTLDQAESLLTGDMPEAQVRLRLERGRVANSSGNPADSIQFFEQALAMAQEAGLEYLAIDAAHMLGIVEQEEAAIRWNEVAIDMAEQAEDDRARGWLGPLYNNLAWTYSDAGEYE